MKRSCRPGTAFLAGLAIVTGCASPSPQFFGAQEHRVVIDGTRFAVFRDGTLAQAIRLDYATRNAQREMPQRLIQAITQTTNCTVRPGTITGDNAVLTARIDC